MSEFCPATLPRRTSWERYIDELRRRRPAVLADILPDLTGVALVLDAAPDFVDPSRVNLRAAIENGAQIPSRQDFADFEPSLFQVGLQLTLPLALHQPSALGSRAALLRIQGLAHLSRHGPQLWSPAAALGRTALSASEPLGRRAMPSRELI